MQPRHPDSLGPSLIGAFRRRCGHGVDRLAGMTKWEYFTVPLLVHATKEILDNVGEEGWELVCVVPGPTPESLVAYLKREKEE
jgi:hypothetical protein